MNTLPNVSSLNHYVSVLIPTYNEEKYIAGCLSAILNQDFPKENFEIIVIDGESTDETCSIVERYMQTHSNIRLSHNKSRITSSAMNIGIREALGDVIIRMDAHAEAPSDYMSKSVDCLLKKNMDVVGCLMETVGSGYWGQRIALALSSPFGVGNANYRIKNADLYNEPGWLGTFWRKSVLSAGGYDELYKVNEDCELSYRMIYKGYGMYIPSDLSCKYFCRTNFLDLWKQYYRYGFWKVAVISKLRKIPSLRHIVPASFLMTLLILAVTGIFSSIALQLLIALSAAYLIFTALGSWKASRRKNIRVFWTMIPVFFVLHFSYGSGFIAGMFSGFASMLKKVTSSISLKRFKQRLRPMLQNKVSAFFIYAADAVYDFARYLIYSGNLYGIASDKEKLAASIFMHCHKIEKGLALNTPRKSSEIDLIVRLVRMLEIYSKNWDQQDITFQGAYAALMKYQKESGPELQKNSPRTAKILHEFLDKHQQTDGKEIPGGTKTYNYRSAAEINKTFDYDFFVKSRHSVRNMTDLSVSREVLDKAIEQARWTPSVCNRQAWRVHVFETQSDKKKALNLQNGNEGFGHSADKILLITCDIRNFFTSRERNQYFIDGGMFSMSLIYALHAAGVASCALNLSTYSFQDIKLHQVLQIPIQEAPIMMIAIGYAPDDLEVPCSYRLPVEKFIKYRES